MSKAFHFFIDSDILNAQSSPSDQFGPAGTAMVNGVQNDQFQVTSQHTNSGGDAYAVCDGIVFIQANSIHTNLVNLILKPTEQPPFNFPKIKFFIYRGIQLTSLINGSDVSAAGTNALTQTIWDSHDALNTSAGTTGPPPKEALGIELTSSLSDHHSIEDVFYRTGLANQFPLVRSGTTIGKFDTSCGFEIMIESIGFDPTLGLVRTDNNMIQVPSLASTPTQPEEFEHWHDKEAILNYIDPCAFWGMFFDNAKLNVWKSGSVSGMNGEDLFSNVISKFNNCSKVYLDIRNEYNYSINYFKNYGTRVNTAFDSNTTVNLTPQNYYASSWPILILENSDFASANTSTSPNVIRLALPDGGGDNPFPTLYVSCGCLDSTYPKQAKDVAQLIDLTITSGLTNEVSLNVPNRSAQSATTVVCSYIKLKYFKRFDPANPTPASSGTVIRAQHYLDNLFAPFEMKIAFAGTATIKSQVYDDEIYVNNGSDIVGIFSIGLYEDTNNYTFVLSPKILKEKTEDQVNISLVGIKSDNFNDFNEHIGSFVNDYNVFNSNLVISSQNVDPYVLIYDDNYSLEDNLNARLDKFISFCIDKATINSFVNSSKYRKYLIFKNSQNFTDDIGQEYETTDLYIELLEITASVIQVNNYSLSSTINYVKL